MKNQSGLFLLFLFIFSNIEAQETKPYSIRGEIKGTANGKIYLAHSCGVESCVYDSADIRNGRFNFSGSIAEPVYAMLSLSLSDFTQPIGVEPAPDLFSFYMDPSSLTVKMRKGNLSKASISGSETQRLMNILERTKAPLLSKMKPAQQEHDRLMTIYLDAKDARVSNDTLDEYERAMAEVGEKNRPYMDQLQKIETDFINKHWGSFAALYLLDFKKHTLSMANLSEYYKRLPASAKESPTGKSFAAYIENAQMANPGAIAYNFSRQALDGKNIRLSDYSDKYVLLDFWASWCVPCRADIPRLMELNKKYSDKGFEIIAISSDSDLSKWKFAVEKDKSFIWPQITSNNFDSHGKPVEDRDNLGRIFNVQSLPTKILIGPGGTVLARYDSVEGTYAELEKKLASIFGS